MLFILKIKEFNKGFVNTNLKVIRNILKNNKVIIIQTKKRKIKDKIIF
jgi:hypothetical protein